MIFNLTVHFRPLLTYLLHSPSLPHSLPLVTYIGTLPPSMAIYTLLLALSAPLPDPNTSQPLSVPSAHLLLVSHIWRIWSAYMVWRAFWAHISDSKVCLYSIFNAGMVLTVHSCCLQPTLPPPSLPDMSLPSFGLINVQ
jgi:hypothetical protein